MLKDNILDNILKTAINRLHEGEDLGVLIDAHVDFDQATEKEKVSSAMLSYTISLADTALLFVYSRQNKFQVLPFVGKLKANVSQVFIDANG